MEGLDDDTHDIIKMHLKDSYDLENCVFRVDGDRRFAEGAICPKCNSSRITYDISKKLLKEMLQDAEKYMGADDDASEMLN